MSGVKSWPTYEELARGGATFVGDNRPPDAWHREMQCQAIANACTLDYDNTHLDNGIYCVGVYSLRDVEFLRYHIDAALRRLVGAVEFGRDGQSSTAEILLRMARDRMDFLIEPMEAAGLR